MFYQEPTVIRKIVVERPLAVYPQGIVLVYQALVLGMQLIKGIICPPLPENSLSVVVPPYCIKSMLHK